MGKRRPLTLEDRTMIQALHNQGFSGAEIAREVGRSRSVISRELARNASADGRYMARQADVAARIRRQRPKERLINSDVVLQQRVWKDLCAGRSPRAIAGRMQAEAAGKCPRPPVGAPGAEGRCVSHEAIYQWMYALPKGLLCRYGVMLSSRRTRRLPRKGLGPKQNTLVGMTPIEDRPVEVAGRQVPGHWEGDLILGKDGKTAAITLVERTTRLLVILALPIDRTAEEVTTMLISEIAHWPVEFKKSLTWDQGREMAEHKKVAMACNMSIYFANPHSPWERGTNENTNRRIRDYIPKGSPVPAQQHILTAIANEINEMPRKVLGWATPREAYEELINQEQVA